MTARRTLGAAAVAVALLALLFLAVDPAVAQQARTRFQSWIIMPKLTVEDAADISGAVTLNSTLDVDGNLSSGTGDLTVADDLYVTGALGAAGAITTASTLNVTGAATLGGALTVNNNANVTGTFNASGNSSVGGTFAVTGDTALSADLFIAAQGAVAVTEGGIITPTGTYQELTAAGAVSTTQIADASGSGTILILVNSSANAITLGDDAGGNLILSGDAVLGQWDTVTLINYGGNWIEIAQADN